MKDVFVGKNVSLSLRHMNAIQDYQVKTRRGFSKTLNIILAEWEKYRSLAENLAIEENKRFEEKYKPKDMPGVQYGNKSE
jgi:hypothetical protein